LTKLANQVHGGEEVNEENWLAVGRNVTMTFDFDIDLILDWTILFLKAIYTGACPSR
jgi:hypothetical protein